MQGLGEGAAGVQWVEVSPRRAGDAAAAETRCHRRGRVQLVRRGGGSLDLKCYCLNAMTDEGMRVVSSLTVLWGCAKVTDERMRAVSSVTGLTSKRYNTPVGAEKRAVASPSTCRSYCEVRWAAEGTGSTTAFHRQSIVRKDPPALYPTEYSVAHEQC